MLPESQPNKNIYKSLDEFLNSIHLENWIILFVFFEFNLIRDLGFDPNLDKFKNYNLGTEFKKIKIDTFSYDVPEYLILRKAPDKLSKNLIKKSLYFTRSIMQNKFFLPNNIPFPKSRVLLESYFN